MLTEEEWAETPWQEKDGPKPFDAKKAEQTYSKYTKEHLETVLKGATEGLKTAENTLKHAQLHLKNEQLRVKALQVALRGK